MPYFVKNPEHRMTNLNYASASQIFDKFVWVMPEVISYGGQISLGKTTLATKDLPKDLISEGGLKLVDPKRFNPIQKFRTNVRNLLLEHGQTFLKGYAIPIEKWDVIEKELQFIDREFHAAVSVFSINWAKYVTEWADLHPKHRDIILNVAPQAEAIRNRFRFTYSATHFSPLNGCEESMANQVRGLKDDIYDDIAKKAKAAINSYEKGSSQITRKMRTTIDGLVTKLKSLAFVSPELVETANVITNFFNNITMPDKGNLDERTQSQIAMLLLAMKDPSNLPDLGMVLETENDKLSSLNRQVSAQLNTPIIHPLSAGNSSVANVDLSTPITKGSPESAIQDIKTLLGVLPETHSEFQETPPTKVNPIDESPQAFHLF